VITIIVLLIGIVFAIPLLLIVFGSIVPYLGALSSTSVAMLALTALVQNMALLVIGGIVFIIGMDISAAFSLKATSDFYLAMKKKKFGIV
jgi:hypothetical protein